MAGSSCGVTSKTIRPKPQGTGDVDKGAGDTIHQHRDGTPTIGRGPSAQVSVPGTKHVESVPPVQTMITPSASLTSTIIWPHF